jgi:hypothetical protein
MKFHHICLNFINDGSDMDLSDAIGAIIPGLEGQALQVLARARSPLTGSRVADLVGADSNLDIVAVFPGDLDSTVVERFVDSAMAGVQLWTGNTCNIYDLTESRLLESMEGGDPIVESWNEDATTFLGPDLRRRIGATA